ncbi:MAG: carboxylating nicotinate-nucleotide diphosphorylase [Candidatus Omnitrophota bacterium]|nr:MAG: carboxylating nicotinate-nucleotide diphosphorylase [Candidatus Omnitrophota bacterium]
MEKLNREKITEIVRQALREDIGKRDITTSFTIAALAKGEAAIIAKEKGILCGIKIAKEVFEELDPHHSFKSFLKDGQKFIKGKKIALIKGRLRAILTAERVALNLLALLSGIATATGELVEKIEATKVKLLDTRKTTPLLRDLEKYAVRIGGGYNHRSSLSDAIIIKDNHLRASKCTEKGKLNEKELAKTIQLIKKKTHIRIEVEVENLTEFKAVLSCKPQVIMLDNFSPAQLKEAVALRNKQFPSVKLEASGGITAANIHTVAHTGVDFISAGSITHSPKAIDFSLEITKTD